MFVVQWLVLSLLLAIVTTAVVHPSAPHEPWWHRLACVVPLSLIAGFVLALPSSA